MKENENISALQDKYLEFLEYLDTTPGNDVPQVLEEIEELIFTIISGREYLKQAYLQDRDKVGIK